MNPFDSHSLMHTATAMSGAFGVVPELSEGSIGAEVRELQSKLNVLQYGPVNVDGKFDSTTTAALKQFQQTEQLPVTGRLDSVSEARLNQRILSMQQAGLGAAADMTSAPPADPNAAAPRPLWQTGLMIVGGVALVGGLFYLLGKADDEDQERGYRRSLAPGSGEKEIPGRYNSKGARVAGVSSRGKCDRTPGADAFSEGEPLNPPEGT